MNFLPVTIVQSEQSTIAVPCISAVYYTIGVTKIRDWPCSALALVAPRHNQLLAVCVFQKHFSIQLTLRLFTLVQGLSKTIDCKLFEAHKESDRLGSQNNEVY